MSCDCLLATLAFGTDISCITFFALIAYTFIFPVSISLVVL
ncbi:hypothetical protein CLOHYLEM_07199 [[Clostridium] hylemonae DSM 15053]|uniref:Uncharacterized protein n=1 Tax=[Clostridium] hylemonae DSM 15053 TaxID=553973 RepID=C0C530_9FIRM|nr:hypothetical protein CLOHYLEM_07199 [[Clostridium] hylemonae DSM 15053]